MGTKKVLRFNSQTSAEQSLNICRGSVSRALSSKSGCANGYQFWREGDRTPKEIKNYRHDSSISVRNIMDGKIEVFANQRIASKAIGVDYRSINQAVIGNRKTTSTYQVWYTSEKPPKFMSKKDFENKRKGENHYLYGKTVPEESRRKMSKAKIGKYTGKKSYWYGKKRSKQDRKKMSERRIGKCVGKDNPIARSVLCISPSGKKHRYGAFAEAERGLTKKYGIRFDSSNISLVVIGKRKHHRGFRFQYA